MTVVADVQGDFLGRELLDELLGGSLVDLDTEVVPALFLAPGPDGVRLDGEPPCDLSVGVELAREEQPSRLLANLEVGSTHRRASPGNAWRDWPGHEPSGLVPACRRSPA